MNYDYALSARFIACVSQDVTKEDQISAAKYFRVHDSIMKGFQAPAAEEKPMLPTAFS